MIESGGKPLLTKKEKEKEKRNLGGKPLLTILNYCGSFTYTIARTIE